MVHNSETQLVRLNKALAAAGAASRRGADALILQGAVKINGKVVDTPGVKVDPKKDRIEVNGKLLGAPDSDAVTILLNKPVQTMTTADDPQGRTTVFDVLGKAVPERLFPVGRLDYFSQGLLLLTNDGDLCHRLMHPSSHLPKVYRVTVRGSVTEDKLNIMRKGMRLKEGETLAPIKVEAVHSERDRTWLEMELIQGVNRQIRRMCRDLKLTILKLERISQGPIKLGAIQPGKWRKLTSREVEALRKAVGLPPS